MEWLKAIRKEKNVPQATVAAAVGISQPSYANIENGKKKPRVETAKRIAAVLDFPWTRFFE